MTVKIHIDDQFIQDGVLIEGRTYSRSADLITGLGFKFDWISETTGGKIIIRNKPLSPGQNMDLRLPSGGNAKMLDSYVKNTPLAGLGAVWMECEAKWRINAVFLCAVACHESNFGKSKIAQDKKNLHGMRAYDGDPYNSAKTYGSFKDSIEDVCSLLVRQYLYPSGSYYNGPTPAGINVKYASDKNWAVKVVNHMSLIVG